MSSSKRSFDRDDSPSTSKQSSKKRPGSDKSKVVVELAADPMLKYLKERGGDKPKIEQKPEYKGKFPWNRYDIKPGYRWDGVDRSNGHEKRLLEKETSKKSREEDDYRNATRDL